MRREQLEQCGIELSAESGRHPRLAAGASIVERVDDPVPRSRAEHSVALDVRLADGQHRWVMMGWTDLGDGSAGGCDDPARPGPYASFAEFVAGHRQDGDGMQL